MFAKLFAFVAFVAVAFASPKPQVLNYAAPSVAYSAGYPGYTAPLAYAASPYAAAAYAASPYAAAAYPYAYSGAYYVR